MDGHGHVDPSGKGWIPGPDLARRELLPGPTSEDVEEIERRRVSRFFLAALILMALGILLAFVVHPVGIALTIVGVLVFFIPDIIMASGKRRRRREEHEAGYTIDRFGPRELDLVDPKTGYVLRPAGQPHLTSSQYRTLLHKSRSQVETG
jgi:hypothetical protein